MKYLTIAVTALGLSTGAVSAASILQAVDATSSVGSFPTGGDYDIDRTIDQSTLSTGYTSGITDFDSYVPSTTHTGAGGASEIWYAPSGVTTATITFDLGGSYLLDGFALWADYQGIGQTLKDFTLTASNDAGFTSTTALGSFIAADGSGSPSDNFGQAFSFGATTASFIQMDILSNHGSTFTVGFGEAAFRISDGVGPSPVPVPASLPLIAAGMIGIGALARRRKST
ncbi:MAG: VPLPA-CTERM sorting domain-containing protein [Gammaproteobacteria bacterium]|nr:VPLPA-CTERM sorting domain-containing protein [Gammaproteobacteria bacterium]